VDPRIPSSWPEFEINYRWGKSLYHLKVENPEGVSLGVIEICIDGKRVREALIPLDDDGREHAVRVLMGNSRNKP
jgi:cellobiose phosphorylase